MVVVVVVVVVFLLPVAVLVLNSSMGSGSSGGVRSVGCGSVVRFGGAPLEGGGEVLLQRLLLPRLGEWLHRSQTVHDVLRLAEVDLVQRVADLILHVLNHLADVGDVRVRVVHGRVLLELETHTQKML